MPYGYHHRSTKKTPATVCALIALCRFLRSVYWYTSPIVALVAHSKDMWGTFAIYVIGIILWSVAVFVLDYTSNCPRSWYGGGGGSSGDGTAGPVLYGDGGGGCSSDGGGC